MSNLFDLTGKVALVTGATSGMGKAIAEAMGLHGAKVIVSSMDTEGVMTALKEFRKKKIECMGVPCDMSQKEDIDTLVAIGIAKFGKIDILV